MRTPALFLAFRRCCTLVQRARPSRCRPNARSLLAAAQSGPVIAEVLPKAGLVVSEKGSLSEILCKPKLMPLKSITLQKLEEMEVGRCIAAALGLCRPGAAVAPLSQLGSSMSHSCIQDAIAMHPTTPYASHPLTRCHPRRRRTGPRGRAGAADRPDAPDDVEGLGRRAVGGGGGGCRG